MPTPEILKGWVAEEGQEPTEVINPCVIDHTAIEDLAFYHPGFDSSTLHRFRHVAAQDEEGPFVRADESFSYNWHEKMQEVMEKLKLRPSLEAGRPCLIDRAIANVATREMHGWRVVGWKVVKARDLNMQVVHQDFISWRDGSDRLVTSMFTWRPYRALEAAPVLKGLNRNERVFLGVARSS
jgi:hypothetical protein